MASDARGDHCRRRWWQRRHRWRRRRRRHRMHRSLHWHDAWTMVAPAPCWSDVRSNFALWRWRQREFVHEGDGSGPSQFNGRSGGRRRRIEKENHRDACRASHALRNPASGPSTLPRCRRSVDTPLLKLSSRSAPITSKVSRQRGRARTTSKENITPADSSANSPAP